MKKRIKKFQKMAKSFKNATINVKLQGIVKFSKDLNV